MCLSANDGQKCFSRSRMIFVVHELLARCRIMKNSMEICFPILRRNILIVIFGHQWSRIINEKNFYIFL